MTKVSWWMRNYGGPTAKPHYLYSNSKHVAKLQKGKLQRPVDPTPSNTCEHYINKNGKRCWVGTKKLKQTERKPQLVNLCVACLLRRASFICSLTEPREYPPKFALKLVSLFNELVDEKAGVPSLPDPLPSISEMCDSATFADMWEEADMGEVVAYLRGGKGLRLSAEYRSLFPEVLPRGENPMDF